MRAITVLTAVLAALLLTAAPAVAAPTATARVQGVEYAASATEGRFGGTARAPLAGAWTAVVVHDPLRSGAAVPITGGAFRLYGARHALGGTFTGGSVTPHEQPATCGNERFDVTGTVALRGGGRGTFSVVLTHLRVPVRSECRIYGATVAGTLTVPVRAAATAA